MSKTQIEESSGKKRNLKRKVVKSPVEPSKWKFLDEPREKLPLPIFTNSVAAFNVFKSAITTTEWKNSKIKVLSNNSIKINNDNSEKSTVKL